MKISIMYNNGATVENKEFYATSYTSLAEVLGQIQRSWYAEQMESITARLKDELREELTDKIREEVKEELRDRLRDELKEDLLEDADFLEDAADAYIDANSGEFSRMSEVWDALGEVDDMRQAFREIKSLAEDYDY